MSKVLVIRFEAPKISLLNYKQIVALTESTLGEYWLSSMFSKYPACFYLTDTEYYCRPNGSWLFSVFFCTTASDLIFTKQSIHKMVMQILSYDCGEWLQCIDLYDRVPLYGLDLDFFQDEILYDSQVVLYDFDGNDEYYGEYIPTDCEAIEDKPKPCPSGEEPGGCKGGEDSPLLWF